MDSKELEEEAKLQYSDSDDSDTENDDGVLSFKDASDEAAAQGTDSSQERGGLQFVGGGSGGGGGSSSSTSFALDLAPARAMEETKDDSEEARIARSQEKAVAIIFELPDGSTAEESFQMGQTVS
jgi:hypothetical protein